MAFCGQPFFVVIAMALAITATTAQQTVSGVPAPEHDGQPGCGIRYEFRRLWRNNFVPEQYWECTQWQRPASVRHCPPATRFQDSWQTCVPFNLWEWTPYSDPPTRPCELVDECEEWIGAPEEPEEPWECPIDTTPNPNTTVTTPDPCPCNPCPCETPVTTQNPPPTTDGGNGGGGGIEEIDPIGTCPGADDEQHNPGTMTCYRPECTISQWLEGTLYPTRDPRRFFQCGPGSGNVFIMQCGVGTCFSFEEQVCVHYRKWKNDCA